jgi:hypothetical protein
MIAGCPTHAQIVHIGAWIGSTDGVLDVCANVVCGIDEVHDLAHPSCAGQGVKWGMPGFAFFA